MSHPETRHWRPTQAVGRLVVMLAALGGLFAMHGLSDHGVAHHGAMVAMGEVGPPAAPQHERHAPGISDHPEASVLEQASAPGPAPDDDDMSMVGLCLAILAAVAALIAVPVLRARGWRAARRLTHARRHHTWVRARDPAPPDLHQLSILRC